MKIINIDVDSELIVKNVYDTESKVEKNDSNSLKIPTGNYKTIMLNFNFISPKFEEADLKLFASFNNDFLDKPVMAEVTSITENEVTYEHACYVPEELLKKVGKVKLGLFGYILNEETQELEKRYSLRPILSEVVLGSFQEDMVNAATPTPTVFEIYFQQVKDMTDQVANDYSLVREKIEEVKNENITDFNKKAEAKKTSLVSDFDTHATEKEEEVKGNIDSHAATKIEEYDEHAEDLISSVADTRNELERVKNEVLETGEASGSYMTLNDSAMAEMQELSIDGVCEQASTTGKNLIPNNALTTTNNGITFTVNSDKSITCNGTATAKATIGLLEEERILSKGNYVLSVSDTSITGVAIGMKIDNSYYSTRTNKPIEITNDTATFYKWYIDIDSGTTLNNVTIYPMLEQGTTTTPYEPYTGGQPSPNPDYPQEIEVIEEDFDIVSCGKNLLDKTLIERDKSSEYGAVGIIPYKIGSSQRATLGIENAIKVKPNTTYTLTIPNGFGGAIAQLESDLKTLGDTGWLTSNTYTITTKSNAKYVGFNFKKADNSAFTDDDWNNLINGTLQFELGELTEYEPYQETKVTFELPEGEFVGSVSNTIKDEAKIVFNEEDGQYHKIIEKNVGKCILSIKRIWANDKFKFAFFDKPTNQLGYGKYLRVPIMSEVSINTTSDREFTITSSGSQLENALLLSLDSTLTIEELKALADGKPFYYQLAEPYTLDLGIVDMPLTFDEVTNISSSHNLQPKINVKYYRNFISTIKNLQVNEKALKQELVDINSRLSALENSLINIASEVNESEVVE